MQTLRVWDGRLFKFINAWLRSRALDFVMPRITHLGGARFSVAACVVLLLLGSWLPEVGWSASFALGGSNIVVQIVKRFITRPRPYEVLPEVELWESLALKDYSFPSGHTTAAFALATVLAVYFPAATVGVYFIAALVGISRIYLGLHYPTDVVIGVLLGVTSGILACL